MRVVLDTNVLISGIFFSGPPAQILTAWQAEKIQIVVSTEIIEEYWRVGERLAQKYIGIDIEPTLGLIIKNAELIQAPPLSGQISRDPHDDKFIACALAGNVGFIISGDNDLLTIASYREVQVLTPRAFLSEYVDNG